jgi:hypothetical protein
VPALRLNRPVQEVLHVRFGNRRSDNTSSAFVQWGAKFVRHVRDRQTASTLIYFA